MKTTIKPFYSLTVLLRTLVVATVLAASPGLVHAAPAEAANTSQAKASQVNTGQVNINTAGIEALTGLSGIGVAKAKAIVDYRSKFGRFQAAEDLMAVEGVGAATLAKNRARITL